MKLGDALRVVRGGLLSAIERPDVAVRESEAHLSGGLTANQVDTYDNPMVPSSQMRGISQFEAHGATGTVFLNGIISQEEYNPDLANPDQFLPIYDKMYRSHGQVAALLRVCMLPLLEGSWSIKAASTDQQDVDVAQFVQDNLMGGMQRTWHETLEFILLGMFRDGFAVLEKVFARPGQDGLIRYAKLAPRLSKTIYRWYPNDDDELDRIQQRVWKPNKDGVSGQYYYPVIPATKLVLFTHRREGNNFQGMSLLRPAYRHWYFLQQLEMIDAIAAERGAVGVPVFREPLTGARQKSDRDIAAQVASSIHTHEKAYVLEPAGWEFRFEGPGAGRNIQRSIDYHSMMIARTALAQFINLDKGGSYALSSDISTFFMQVLHSVARYIRDVFDRDVIRPLVDLNINVERYPTLEVTDLDKRDIQLKLRGLAAVLPFLHWDADTENALRGDLGLPDLAPGDGPSAGGAPTVDTDSQGKAAAPTGTGATAPMRPPPSGYQWDQDPVTGDIDEPTEAEYADLERAIEVTLQHQRQRELAGARR